MPWLDPSLTLRWGPYTKLDGDEQQKIVVHTVTAKEAGIITTRMAVEKIAPIFNIENVDAAMTAIEEEQTKKAAVDLARMTAQSAAEQDTLHKISSAKQKGNRAAGRGEPKGTSPSGSGSGRAAPSGEE